MRELPNGTIPVEDLTLADINLELSRIGFGNLTPEQEERKRSLEDHPIMIYNICKGVDERARFKVWMISRIHSREQAEILMKQFAYLEMYLYAAMIKDKIWMDENFKMKQI